jgi:hypothetical protein
MSRFEDLKEQALADQSQAFDDLTILLEADDAVEVIATDEADKPFRVVAEFKGITIPHDGGPISIVLKRGDSEMSFDPEYIAGMTKLG